jgi:hypothetical protein
MWNKDYNKFASMFPLPPNKPEGKGSGSLSETVSLLNPVDDKPAVEIDRGIMDGAWFVFSPNETKKFASVQTIDYNFINIVDAIFVEGAKCYLDWVNQLAKEINIIHTEFYVAGVADRVTYKERQTFDSYRGTEIQNAVPNKTDANTVYDYGQPCTMVEGVETAKHPPETRKWIHRLRYTHPLVDEKIRGLKLYEPVSEHMGENVITYNSDTEAVDVLEWKRKTRTEKNIINPECVFAYETPHVLREIIRERMHYELPDKINDAWTELNRMQARTLPKEILLTTEEGKGVWLLEGPRDPKEPHGQNCINDFYHWKDRIDPIKIPVAADLFAYLNDACQLVNHMYPLLNNVRAERRFMVHEPLIQKTIDQNWVIYERGTPEGGAGQAPLEVIPILDRWGYATTEIVTYDWVIGVGLAIEETYPRKKLGSGTFIVDLLGTKPGLITPTSSISFVDNRSLIPLEVGPVDIA